MRAGYAQCIDIETAWQRVLRHAPSLAAVDAEISAMSGELEQVSRTPNPLLEVESENLGMGHPSDDVEPPQTTFSLAQLIELGGKRGARCKLAYSQKNEAYWEAQIERENTYFDLILMFIQVRAAEEKWRIASERLEVSENALEAIKRQIENGKLSPIQEKRARIEVMAQTLALREAFSEYEQAKMRLSSMWGSRYPDFDQVDFELYAFVPPPCEILALEGFYQTPDYFKAQQAVDSASKNLTLQKANGIPDVTLMAGYRLFHDTLSGGLVVGAVMPIPLSDRNQGGVKRACSLLSQARYALEEVTRNAHEKISTAYERLTTAYEETEMMYRTIICEAQESVKLTESGYCNGKFDYLELLEAHKLLFEMQEKYVDVLCDYHQNRAELARLSGMNL